MSVEDLIQDLMTACKISVQDIRLDLLAHPPPVHLAQCGSTLHMICIDFVIVQRCSVQASELQ